MLNNVFIAWLKKQCWVGHLPIRALIPKGVFTKRGTQQKGHLYQKGLGLPNLSTDFGLLIIHTTKTVFSHERTS